MMPTLHNLDATTESFRDWRTNGAGILNDAISCVVTENRNGEFDLEMTYPLVGVLYDEIKIGSMIMATHDATQIDEVFVVYRITENINGIATIYAHHITYDMNYVVIEPSKPVGLLSMLNHCNGVTAAAQGVSRPATGGRFVNTGSVIHTPDDLYNLYTNRSGQDSKDWLISAPKSLRSIVFELVEYYGYEIKWGSPPNVYLFPGGGYKRVAGNPKYYTAATLMTARGKDTGASIRYGGNLLSAEKTTDVDSQFARVLPYYGEKTRNDSENTYASYTITYRGVIDSGEVYFYFTKPFDLNGFFDEQPTQAQVTASDYISDYFVEEKVGEKLESVTINFSPFMDVGYNFDANILQNLCLCDWVNIEIDQLGISKKAKVVKTVYDTLRDRYVSLTVGEVEKSFAETVQDGVAAVADSSSESGGGGSQAITWVDLTVESGVTNPSTNVTDARKLQIGKVGNHVYIRGHVDVAGLSSGNKIIANLPSEYVPSYPAYSLGAFTGARIAKMFVLSSGEFGITGVYNISDGARYTTKNWLDCSFNYWLD